MANKFIVSWEFARGILKPGDPDSSQPYNPGKVISAMFPFTGIRDSDRTLITQYDFALAMDGPIAAAPTLAPGVMGAVASALVVSLPTQPPELGADGVPPLYLARTNIVPSNPGVAIINAVSVALGLVQVQIIAPPFFGVPPPTPALTVLVQAAWLAQAPFANVVTLFDAAMIRYITAAFTGGEGGASDPPAPGLPVSQLNPVLSVVIDNPATRDVTFTNSSTEPTSDPGLAWVVKTDDTSNFTVDIGGPGATATFQYDSVPAGPTTFNPSIVGGNKAGTVESPTIPVFFAL